MELFSEQMTLKSSNDFAANPVGKDFLTQLSPNAIDRKNGA
jgi:hypothetical protein